MLTEGNSLRGFSIAHDFQNLDDACYVILCAPSLAAATLPLGGAQLAASTAPLLAYAESVTQGLLRVRPISVNSRRPDRIDAMM